MVLVVMCALACAPSILFSQTVNPGFESGVPNPWQVSGNGQIVGTESNPIGTAGLHAFALGTFDVANSVLSQTAIVPSNQSVDFSFDWAVYGDGAAGKRATFDALVTTVPGGVILYSNQFTALTGSLHPIDNGIAFRTNFNHLSTTLSIPVGVSQVLVRFVDKTLEPQADVLLDEVVINVDPGNLPSLLVNPSFETGGADSWQVTGNVAIAGTELNAIGTDGNYSLSIGSFNVPNTTLSQTINVNPGVYLFKFSWVLNGAGVPGRQANFAALVGSTGGILVSNYLSGVSGSLVATADGPAFSTNFVTESYVFTVPEGVSQVTVAFHDKTSVTGVDPILDEVIVQSIEAKASLALVPSITWSSSVGIRYRVLRKADLNAPTWDIIGEGIVATSNSTTFYDHSAPLPNAVYQVEVMVL